MPLQIFKVTVSFLDRKRMSVFYFKVVVRKHSRRKWFEDCSEIVRRCHLTAVLGSWLCLYLCSSPSSGHCSICDWGAACCTVLAADPPGTSRRLGTLLTSERETKTCHQIVSENISTMVTMWMITGKCLCFDFICLLV